MMRGEIMMRDEDPPLSPAPAPRPTRGSDRARAIAQARSTCACFVHARAMAVRHTTSPHHIHLLHRGSRPPSTSTHHESTAGGAVAVASRESAREREAESAGIRGRSGRNAATAASRKAAATNLYIATYHTRNRMDVGCFSSLSQVRTGAIEARIALGYSWLRVVKRPQARDYCRFQNSHFTLHRAPVGQGPPGPGWLAISFGFWSGRALATTGTAWAGLCLIHHHRSQTRIYFFSK